MCAGNSQARLLGRLFIAVMLLSMVVSLPRAFADTIALWTGNTSGNINTGTNWIGGTAPVNVAGIMNFGPGNVTNISLNLGANNTVASAQWIFNTAQNYSVWNGTWAVQAHNTGPDGAGIYLTGNTGNITFNIGLNEGTVSNDDFILQNNGTGTLTLAHDPNAGNITGNIATGVPATGNIDLTREAIITLGTGNIIISNNISGNNTGPTTNFNPTGLNFWQIGGNVTLSGNNTFTGDSELDAGALNLGSNTALGGNSTRVGTFYIYGGALDISGTSNITLTNNNDQFWADSFTYTGSNTSLVLNMGTGKVVLNDNIGVTVLAGNLVENGNISGNPDINGTNFGITKDGGGTLTLGGTNTFGGNTTVSAGTLKLTNSLALQQSTYNAIGGNLNFTTLSSAVFGGLAGNQNIALTNSTAGAVALSVGNNNSNTTYSGNLTGSGSLTKIGSGVTTLNGQNTYSGNTTVNAGTLLLDFFSAVTASNITSNSSALVLGGGTFKLVGNPGHTNSQTVNGVFVNPGDSSLVLTQNGATSLSMTTGAISRSIGGTLDFTLPTTGGITTSATNTNGAAYTLGGVAFATVGDTDWATINSAGNIVAMAAGNYTSNVITANGNVSLSSSPAAINNTTINNLRFTGATNTTVTVNNGQVLNITTGGILVTGTGNDSILGGNLTSGSTAKELVVFQNSTGGFIIGSNIVDNGGATALTKSGTGQLTLSGTNNTFTGNTTVGAGTLLINNANALQSSTLNMLAGNVAFNTGITSATLGGLAGPDDLSLTNTGNTAVLLSVGNNNASTTYSGALTGLGNLTKIGTGTLTLSGNNTYAGNTTISNGNLALGSAAALPAGANVSLANTTNTNLQLNGFAANIAILSGGGTNGGNIALGSGLLTTGSGNASTTYSGNISGTGGLTKVGSGTFTITGNNTYSGNTTVDNGTLKYDFSATTASSNITANTSALILSGGNLNITGRSGATLTQTFSGTLVGAGNNAVSATQNGATSLTTNFGTLTRNLGGTVDFTLPTTGGFVTSNTSTAGGAVTSGNVAYATVGGVDWATINSTGNITAMASGNYKVNLAVGSWSGGNVSLGNAATFTLASNTAINTLRFTSASTISIGAGVSLNITQGGLMLASNFGGTATISGAGSLLTDVNNSELAVLVENSTANLVISAAVNNWNSGATTNNNMGLTKAGAGTLTLNAANNLTGNTTVTAGTLNVSNSLALQSSTVNLIGGNLTFGNTAATFGGLAGTQDLSLTSNASSAVALTIGNNSFNTSYYGNLTGAGSLTKINTGTTYLYGSGNYTGGTTLSGGVLGVQDLSNGGNNSSIGSSSAVASNLVISNATLRYVGAGDSTNRLFTLSGNGGTVIDSSGTGNLAWTNTGALSFAGNNNNAVLGLSGTNGGNNTFAPQITNNGTNVSVGVTKGGAGRWYITNANNTYSGVTTLNEGTLAINTIGNGGNNSSIGNSTAAGTSLVINGGTLQYLGAGNTTDRSFTVGAAGGTIEASGTGNLVWSNTGALNFTSNSSYITLSLGGNNTGNNTLAANLTNGTSVTAGSVANTLGLTKKGDGMWMLTGVSSNYTGPTTIMGGTLNVAVFANGGTVSSIGAANTTASNLILNGGTLQYTGASNASTDRLFSLGQYSGTLDSSGAGNLTFSGSGAITYATPGTSPTLTLTGCNTGNNTLGPSLANNSGGITNLAKTGNGQWILTRTNTFTGSTNITGGTLVLKDQVATGALSGTSRVDVSNGTLLLGAADQINNSAPMALSYATFNTGGFSETMATMTLTNASNIDFGAGASIVHYSDSSATTWASDSGNFMVLLNWSGNYDPNHDGHSGGNGTDRLYYGSSNTGLTTSQLGQIRFFNPAGLPSGYYLAEQLITGEVVPYGHAVPVPEPSTYAAGGVLASLAGWWEWRRRRDRKLAAAKSV